MSAAISVEATAAPRARVGPVFGALMLVIAGLVELLSEAEDFLAVAVAIEVLADGVGLSVDGLSAGAALLGESGDVAIASEEGGGGAGDAVEDG